MIEVLSVTLPIYLIIAAGFASVRTGYVGGDEIRSLGRVVMRVCMPATIFFNIQRSSVAEILRWDFVLGYLAASLLVFAAGFAFARLVMKRPHQTAVLEAMGMSCSNSAFMGFPVAAMVVGDAALHAFTMAMMIENIVMMPLAVTLADSFGGQGGGQGGGKGHGRGALRQTLSGMARNPMLLAVVAAVVFSFSGLALPTALARTLEMLAPVSAPVALLAVGGAVASLPMERLGGSLAYIVAGKLIAHPLAVLLLFLAIGTLPQDLLISGMLIASVPMMSIYALFGLRWGEERLAASALIVTTVLSFFTVSGLLWLIGFS